MKEFIKNKYNFISFAVALIPSILLWIFQPTKDVPYWIFAIIVLLCICLLWLALMSYFRYCDVKVSQGLSILSCMENVILCRPSANVGLNVIVTIYELKNQYEQKLGYGYIQNIQQNGIIQISIMKSLVNEMNSLDLVNYVDSNSGNIIIKTVATTDTIDVLNKNERS